MINSNSLTEFLDRFYSFKNAIVQRIQYDYLPNGTQQCSIELLTKDQKLENYEHFFEHSNVTIIISDISNIRFREWNKGRLILSDGLNLRWINGKINCELYCFDPEETKTRDLRSSDFEVIGTTISWIISI